MTRPTASGSDAAATAIDLVAERSRLGGLERWLDDPAITEVIVNGGRDVWVERGGRLERVATMRPAAVLGALEQILSPIGRRLDRASPMVDARLPDGSRVCAAIPPVAVDGPALAVRRFALRALGLDAFAPPAIVAVLGELVAGRCNVLVCGQTSSGKTTLLNALAGGVPSAERIVTLEDLAELRLDHEHVVRLEARPASPDGVGEVDLAQLLRTALRLRPDRLVVGEVRGAEAVELLQAMNTGHDGSLATVHANSAEDAVERLASLVVQRVPGWPIDDIRANIHRAIDVVVAVRRDGRGRRAVERIVELPADAAAPRVLSDGCAALASLHRRRR